MYRYIRECPLCCNASHLGDKSFINFCLFTRTLRSKRQKCAWAQQKFETVLVRRASSLSSSNTVSNGSHGITEVPLLETMYTKYSKQLLFQLWRLLPLLWFKIIVRAWHKLPKTSKTGMHSWWSGTLTALRSSASVQESATMIWQHWKANHHFHGHRSSRSQSPETWPRNAQAPLARRSRRPVHAPVRCWAWSPPQARGRRHPSRDEPAEQRLLQHCQRRRSTEDGRVSSLRCHTATTLSSHPSPSQATKKVAPLYSNVECT